MNPGKRYQVELALNTSLHPAAEVSVAVTVIG